MPQSSPGVSAFDEAGQIGQHKIVLIVHRHYAQVGLQSGEGVVGDFGTGRADCRQ